MHLHHGYSFNRFGEELKGSSEDLNKESTTDVKSMIDKSISDLQKEFSTEAKAQFDRVKTELLDRAKVQVDFQPSYVSVKNKRIVSMSDGIDNSDAVNKKQLDNIDKKVKKISKGFEITDDCIKLKDHRRLCNISRAKEPYDAVNYTQLMEMNNKLVVFQNAVNGSLSAIRDTVEAMNRKYIEAQISNEESKDKLNLRLAQLETVVHNLKNVGA